MRHQYRDTADWDALHGIEPEPVAPLLEHCPKHGAWRSSRAIDECPACREHYENLAAIRDAEWDYRTSHHR